MDRILRKAEVLRVCGISQSTLYDMMARGILPRAVRIGVRSVGWRESQVRDWVESRPPASEDLWGDEGGA